MGEDARNHRAEEGSTATGTLALSAVLATITLAACGSGTAAVASGGGSDGGGGDIDAPAVVTNVELDAKTSPATLRFSLADADGGAAPVVDLLYSRAGGAAKPMTKAAPVGPVVVGTTNTFSWDFANEGDLGSGELVEGIAVQVQVRNGGGAIVAGAIIDGSKQNALAGVRVGNDAPIVTDLAVSGPGELSEIIDLSVRVRDSSDDPVDVVIEFKLASEPEGAFRIVRSTSISASLPAEPVSLEAVAATAVGSTHVFRWESDFRAGAGLPASESQLPGLEVDVVLRATARDSVAAGTSVTTSAVRIDNNRAPLAVLDEANFVLSLDKHGTIPVDLRLIDDESDVVDVLVQWRTQDQDFPALVGPGGTALGAAELVALVADPRKESERRRLQIGRQVPLEFTGSVASLAAGALPADEVRLPELAGSQAALVGLGLAGRSLELLRPADALVEPTWTSNPLAAPVASILGRDGRTVFVLDHDGADWTIVEVDLETGAVASSATTSGAGEPLALAVDPARTHLFVASNAGLFRTEFPALTGTTQLATNPFTIGAVPRGIAALGPNVVVVTGDDAVVRFDFSDPGVPVQHVLLDGLANPWGIAVDPLRTNAIYVAEQGADRILSLDLDVGVPLELTAEVDSQSTLGPIPFPSPRAIALERRGARLLAVCQTTTGGASLRTLALRSPVDRSEPPDGLADPFVVELGGSLDDATASVTSDDSIRVATPAQVGSNELAVAGGPQRRGTIVAESQSVGAPSTYDPLVQVVTLDAPFAPPASPGSRWRVQVVDARFRSSPTGTVGTFRWDSSEAPGDRPVQLRAIPVDSDIGTLGAGTSFKDRSTDFGVVARTLAVGDFPRTIRAADLNGDGAPDLIVTESEDSVSAFFQTAPGEFGPTPDVVLEPPGFVLFSLAVADLDLDGELDVVTADRAQNPSDPGTLSIFLQVGSGSFGALPDQTLTAGAAPDSVDAGDLNGDGAPDLVCANRFGSTLSVFLQTGGGVFPLTADQTLSAPSPLDVELADLDADGLLDIVHAGFGGVGLFLQAGIGGFGASPDRTLPLSSPGSVRAVDLDRDGWIDLVASDIDSDRLVLYFGRGGGLFDSAPDRELLVGSNTFEVEAGDVDGDGRVDLAVVSTENGINATSLFFQRSDGSFPSRPDQAIEPTDPSINLAVEDLNGDGRLDVVTNGFVALGNGSLSFTLQDGRGSFAGVPDQVLPIINQTNVVLAADLDGNGLADIVDLSFAGEVTLRFQDPGGIGTTPDVQFALESVANFVSPKSAKAVDLSGDGRLDLLIASDDPMDGNRLEIFLQSATGGFASVPDQTVPLTSGLEELRFGVGDLNGDGAFDVPISDDDDVQIFFGQPGTGSLGATPDETLVTTGISRRADAADMSGDGLDDLLSFEILPSGFFGARIHFQSPGQLAFDPNADRTIAGPDDRTVIGDLNGDGALDLASPNFSTGTVTTYLQSATGAFSSSPTQVLTVGSQPRALFAGDLDDDGVLDLITFNQNLTISTFLHTGAGVFGTTPTQSFPSDGADALAVADVNSDGALDIVTGFQAVSIHLNRD